MISQQNQIHLRELINIYYPNNTSSSFSVDLSSFDSESSLPQQRTLINPEKNTDGLTCQKLDGEINNYIGSETNEIKFKNYRCCCENFLNYKLAVDHWIKIHHTPAIIKSETFTLTQFGILPKIKVNYTNTCQSYMDLGKPDLPLFERASFFLRNNKCCPTEVKLFRPYPTIKDPCQILNPYSAALAVAYDFIQVINDPTKEYQYFLSKLLKSSERDICSGSLRDHMPYWYFWYQYLYHEYNIREKTNSNLEKTKTSNNDIFLLQNKEHKSKSILNKTSFSFHYSSNRNSAPSALRPSCHSSNKVSKHLYVCKTPGCNKSYKQLSGLRYHKEQGKCLSELQRNYQTLTFHCNFEPCRASYSTMTGLKYHISRKHLQMELDSQNQKFEASHKKLVCPLGKYCFIKFTNRNQLRLHIIQRHLPKQHRF